MPLVDAFWSLTMQRDSPVAERAANWLRTPYVLPAITKAG
jgi:hypothetical protein